MITDRIKQIIEYKNISTRQFCREIGVSNGFFAKVTDIGVSKVANIIAIYPEISINWLVTGEGEMLKHNQEPIQMKQLDPLQEQLLSQQRTIENLSETIKKLSEKL